MAKISETAKFIFDMDGTLTESSQQISNLFGDWLLRFCDKYDCFVITGSDYGKVYNQLGEELCMKLAGIYTCSGNESWRKGNRLSTNQWALPSMARAWLQSKLDESECPVTAGNHFEYRPGTCNFSIVGRDASLSQRAEYIKWDKSIDERNTIVEEFNKLFRTMEARAGGETGIDIVKKGCNKSQVIKHFSDTDTVYFFGDKISNGGNDAPFAEANVNGVNIEVENWRDTYTQLMNVLQERNELDIVFNAKNLNTAELGEVI